MKQIKKPATKECKHNFICNDKPYGYGWYHYSCSKCGMNISKIQKSIGNKIVDLECD